MLKKDFLILSCLGPHNYMGERVQVYKKTGILKSYSDIL